jgi:hypothetical protein
MRVFPTRRIGSSFFKASCKGRNVITRQSEVRFRIYFASEHKPSLQYVLITKRSSKNMGIGFPFRSRLGLETLFSPRVALTFCPI